MLFCHYFRSVKNEKRMLQGFAFIVAVLSSVFLIRFFCSAMLKIRDVDTYLSCRILKA